MGQDAPVAHNMTVDGLWTEKLIDDKELSPMESDIELHMLFTHE